MINGQLVMEDLICGRHQKPIITEKPVWPEARF